jgi:hypothetical protein
VGFRVSGDVEDNLAFMVKQELTYVTGSYFIHTGVALSKGINVGNVCDLTHLRQRMSAPFNQAQCSTSVFWSPLNSLRDLIKQLQRN